SCAISGCEKTKESKMVTSAVGCLEATEIAFELNGRKVTVEDMIRENRSQFHEIEKRKAELIISLARKEYIKEYFEDLGKKNVKSPEDAQKQFLDEHGKVTEQELSAGMIEFAGHPDFAALAENEKKAAVQKHLEQRKSLNAVRELVDQAIKEKKLSIAVAMPDEIRYPVPVNPADSVRYGSSPDDVSPAKCEGDKCPVTIVEYVDYQSPFCAGTILTAKKLLDKYKGSIRWITRYFPLESHKDARPSIAAVMCAAEQKKFWHMHEKIFFNQASLSKDDLARYALQIDLEKGKFEACFSSSEKFNRIIDEQIKVAHDLGVTGIPAFFVNGRALSGVTPMERFEEIIREEIDAAKQKG
ncbi:MAG: thioredoxin domain-containing protein, partial [Oligoflexales bacterium]|nr:thioredoxin domain-containing protein [Oligoflexales bacterium]